MNENPMLVEKDFKVNAYDIDVMGIVSNIVYIRWFENLRFGLLDQFWPYEEMLRPGQSPILAKTTAEYHRPVTIFDRPQGKLWVSNLTRSRWEVALEITIEGKVACSGHQIGYFYDMNKKKPVPIPEALRLRYEQALDE